jgi:hypothetical protein
LPNNHYSLLSDLTGSLLAALNDWKLIVSQAIRKATIPAVRYKPAPISVLYV